MAYGHLSLKCIQDDSSPLAAGNVQIKDRALTLTTAAWGSSLQSRSDRQNTVHGGSVPPNRASMSHARIDTAISNPEDAYDHPPVTRDGKIRYEMERV